MVKVVYDEEMRKVSGGNCPENFTYEIDVRCPVCGDMTKKNIAVCDCDPQLWESDMFLKSLCEKCEKEYHDGKLESKVKFKPIEPGETDAHRIVIGLKESASPNLDINN